MYNYINKLASAIHNNVVGGLSGYHTNFSISMEQLEDAVVNERLAIIKEYSNKGILSPEDLYVSINCITIDCKDIESCRCSEECGTPTAHFQIPQVQLDLGTTAIKYLGSTDKTTQFIWYTSPISFKYHKYKKRGKTKPFIWINPSPNEDQMYDCWVFNAPLLNQLSITAIFKDVRQLEQYGCCQEESPQNLSFIDSEIIERVSRKILNYYRSGYMRPIPNDQQYTPA